VTHGQSSAVPAAPAGTSSQGLPSSARQNAARFVQAAIEALVLLMACLAPWAFGGVDRRFEQAACAVIAVLLVLWSVRAWIERRLVWHKCPLAVCLALLALVGTAQLIRLPPSTLGWLSPATSSLYQELLPAEPEVLETGELVQSASQPGSTLSLYPAATRRTVFRALAVLFLFLAVRNNVSPAGGLRRLSMVMLANAALLSLFGFVQFFTSPRGLLYWTYPSAGTVFGPFVNRNHFAFYANIAIGLGLGLLLSRGRASAGMSDPPGAAHASAGRREGGLPRAFAQLLEDPAALWISTALGLTLAATVFCLSRGGFVALLGASAVCGVLALSGRRDGWRPAAVILAIAVGACVLTWFGYERIAARLGTLWSGELLQDDRLKLLTRGWSCFQQFPLLGTGYGTFPFIEPIYIHDAADVGSIYRYAHNEYLQAAIEGGLLRLCLAVVAVALVYRQAGRALRTRTLARYRGFVIGGLFGFTTVVIHSFFEFGLQMPAIAILVTVLAAHLSGLGSAATAESRAAVTQPDQEVDATLIRLGGAAPVLASAVAILLGALLVQTSAELARAENLRRAAQNWRVTATSAGRQLRALRTVAASLAPDAELEIALGEACLEYDRQIRETAAAGTSSPNRLDSLRHLIRGRDLCPLLPVPHVRLAANHGHLQRGDSPGTYLDRARRVAPADPYLWFLCGTWELSAGQPRRAWASWRRSLELSDRHLPRILAAAGTHLTAAEMLQQVLPDQSGVLLSAAREYAASTEPAAAARSRVFLSRAMSLLHTQHDVSADEWARLAATHTLLGEIDEAVAAWERALALAPTHVPWRYAVAEQLYERGRLDEARKQLRLVLAYEPRHSRALALLKDVTRRLTERSLDPQSP
jgi:tetratricopeptide (TPR) repeat protein